MASLPSTPKSIEYLLTYKVRFSIQNNTSTIKSELAESKSNEYTIALTRSLLFDPDAVLAASTESDILYKDMRRDAARSILLKLQALSKPTRS